ncbi:MAG: hypothetical protein FVQ85_03890 [Planctomycetes bacterium]|nr:hypothetical protein [Planctomycetota bacterium]
MLRSHFVIVALGCVAVWHLAGVPCRAGGKIKGTAGGIERGASLFARDGSLRAWTVTGPSGLYEFGGIEQGQYFMLLNGRIVPYVSVENNKTTIVDQASQPKLDLEKEVWGPGRVRFAQSFIATGTAVTGFSLWRASGDSKLLVSLFEDSPSGRRIAGPFQTEKRMVWICGSGLPAELFRTIRGRKYALELAAADGKRWNHGMPRKSDVYPGGVAYYDGVEHPESDLGIEINQAQPGLKQFASAREDLHFIAEGPGSGVCRVAGQTFIATTPNVIQAFANCGGWGGGAAEFIFSIHENGPGGSQIGPACHVKMVCNWGADVVWFDDAVRLRIGEQYYLQYRRADNEPFFSYLSKDRYGRGRAFRDGKELPEQFDQLFYIRGEQEPGSVIYPYNVSVTGITATGATVIWQTGTAGDSLIHYGTDHYVSSQAGSKEDRDKTHKVVLSSLKPATVYLYRVSSDTHKESSRRTYSRIYSFMTTPRGRDEPRFDKPRVTPPVAGCKDCIAIDNPGFEDGTKGWRRIARLGRAKEPQRYVPDAEPFGAAGASVDGYEPHGGSRLYGWSYFGSEDPNWQEPREDWKREVIFQRVAVEAGRTYLLTAWLLTGDIGSGWGRDCRIRLLVDENDAGLLERFDTVEQANVTQWFATQHRWMPVTLRFKAKGDYAAVGAEFLQWWALKASHLYIDDFSIRPQEP